jgi:hypothetical protein
VARDMLSTRSAVSSSWWARSLLTPSSAAISASVAPSQRRCTTCHRRSSSFGGRTGRPPGNAARVAFARPDSIGPSIRRMLVRRGCVVTTRGARRPAVTGPSTVSNVLPNLSASACKSQTSAPVPSTRKRAMRVQRTSPVYASGRRAYQRSAMQRSSSSGTGRGSQVEGRFEDKVEASDEITWMETMHRSVAGTNGTTKAVTARSGFKYPERFRVKSGSGGRDSNPRQPAWKAAMPQRCGKNSRKPGRIKEIAARALSLFCPVIVSR